MTFIAVPTAVLHIIRRSRVYYVSTHLNMSSNIFRGLAGTISLVF